MMAGPTVQASTVTIPARIPLPSGPENRNNTTTKDAKIVNAYVEKMPDGTVSLFKRPGMLASANMGSGGYSSASPANGNGCYIDRAGNLYFIFGKVVYINGAAAAGVNIAFDSPAFFIEMVNSAYPVVILQPGVAYGISFFGGGTVVALGSFPGTGGIYYNNGGKSSGGVLDGTLYVGGSVTVGGIFSPIMYSSALYDPSSWPALNTIIPQIESDNIVAVRKQQSFIIVFKLYSIELFYDAGASNFPALSYAGAKKNIGCAHAQSIQDIEGLLIFASLTREGSIEVYTLNNLQLQKISTPFVDRLLDDTLLTPATTTILSWTHKDEGHTFYVLTSITNNITLAYDLSTGAWQQWTDVSGNYMPIVGSTTDTGAEHYLQHATNGKVYKFDNDYTNDDGSVITVDIFFPNFDGGTRRKKSVNQLEVLYDQQAGAQLQTRYSDDDYNTFSTFRTLDLGQPRALLQNDGSFRRRAYHWRHQSDTPLHLLGLEWQVDIGTT